MRGDSGSQNDCGTMMKKECEVVNFIPSGENATDVT